jgi:hypothetical protein
MGITTTGAGGSVTNTVTGGVGGVALATQDYSIDFLGGSGFHTTIGSDGFDLTNISKTTFAFSVWMRIDVTSIFHTLQYLYYGNGGSNEMASFFIGSNENVRAAIVWASNGRQVYFTPASGISTSTWYHLYFKVDSTQATASDRVEIYINGTESISGTPTYPNQNEEMVFNPSPATDASVRAGADPSGNSRHNGLSYQAAFFDGDAGDLPTIDQVYNSGSPPDLTGISSLHSLMWDGTNTPDSAEDYVLAADWDTTLATSSTTP